jgi:hypothetical protein
VSGAVRTILDNQASMIASLQESGTEISDVDQIVAVASDWRRRLASETEAPAAIGELIASVHLTDKGIRIVLQVPIPSTSEEQPSAPVLRLSHFVPMKVRRRGLEMRIIIDGRLNARQQRPTSAGAGANPGRGPDVAPCCAGNPASGRSGRCSGAREARTNDDAGTAAPRN